MWGRGSRKRTLVCRFVLLVCGARAGAPGAAAAEAAARASFDQVRLGDGEAAMALRAALRRAAWHLSAPACQGVLSEFQDANGRTLQAVLDETGQSSASHMAGLFFYDGSQMPQCKNWSTLAFTSPGSRVIVVCPTQFRSQERRNASDVDVVIIHETLHTLGLGENPPTSQYISARVFSRCVANASRR